MVEFTNSVAPDEVVHNEPPRQNLQCLSLSLTSQYDILD